MSLWVGGASTETLYAQAQEDMVDTSEYLQLVYCLTDTSFCIVLNGENLYESVRSYVNPGFQMVSIPLTEITGTNVDLQFSVINDNKSPVSFVFTKPATIAAIYTEKVSENDEKMSPGLMDEFPQ